jgi:formimidoylglutamate deiminase
MEASVNTTWIADTALLPTGWAHDVSIQLTETGHIHSVGPTPAGGATPDSPGGRIKGVVIPALPNLHSHAFQRGMVGRAERYSTGPSASAPPDDFWSWRSAMYSFLGQLDPEAIEDVATLLYVEMLRCGYGSVAEFHYVHHDTSGRPYDDPQELSRRLIRAAQRAGIRLTLVPVVYESAGFGGIPLEAAQRRFARSASATIESVATLRADSSSPTCAFGIGLHSLRAVPPEALAEIVAWADGQPEVPVHIHVAEQPAEVDACLAWSGARPVQWLYDHAPVDSRWCLVHATHVDTSERTRIAESGAVVVLCPTTEANLGDGIFPLSDYEAGGGSWGVGSDSQVSVCPADELRTLEYGQRLSLGTRVVAGRHAYPGRSNGRALVQAALESGTRALAQPVGRLEAGAAADLVVLDPAHPRLLGLEGDAVLDGWIFGAGAEVVRDVMVGGRWVVRDGTHTLWETAVENYGRVVSRLQP